VQVNGTHRELPEKTTIQALLEELALSHAVVAVERNQAVVPKRLHGETILQEGDRVEVVSLVGGG
jgi:sulfur carrier protein